MPSLDSLTMLVLTLHKQHRDQAVCLWKRRESERMPNFALGICICPYSASGYALVIFSDKLLLLCSIVTFYCYVHHRLGQKSEYHLLRFVLPVRLVTLVEVYAGVSLHLNLCHT